MLTFRKAAADWYRTRFGVSLDPATEVLTLIGSKEGIGHLPWRLSTPATWSWCRIPPTPSIRPAPSSPAARLLHAADPAGFLPDLGAIPAAVAKRAKILWLNYPNNPTGAVAPREFLAEAVAFAQRTA